MRVVATAAAFIVLPGILGSPAQDNRSLTDFESGPRGQEIEIPAPDDSGADSLEEKLILARAAIKSLTESLAVSNSEGEVFKRQAADLQLKLDAYGLASLDKQPEKVEQRLLAAVRDLRVLKKQNEDAVNQLVRLSESIQVLIKKSDGVDPQARLNVETELRKTSEILGSPNAPSASGTEVTLSDGMIVDVKEDLSLVVGNMGAKNGVKVGMPFQIWRDNQRIGTARVVDVRDRICGAVIQNLESEKNPAKAGDSLRVDAR